MGTEREKSWYNIPPKVPQVVSGGFQNMGVFRTLCPSVGAVLEIQDSRESPICQPVRTPSGGPGVKNPPANVRDRGLIPGPGRFHMMLGNKARVPQLLSPGALQQENPPW